MIDNENTILFKTSYIIIYNNIYANLINIFSWLVNL